MRCAYSRLVIYGRPLLEALSGQKFNPNLTFSSLTSNIHKLHSDRNEVFMNANLKIIFGLLGGLAMFLFGMNMMSESLKKSASGGQYGKSSELQTSERA